VVRAVCKQTGEERAIKILKRQMMNESKTRLFLAETSLLKQLSHPSIIKVYDLYNFESNYYVVM
jgi:serine/threonine protein kinase